MSTNVEITGEIGVVGSILISPDALSIVRTQLIADDFYTESGRAVFRAACALEDAGEVVDPATIRQKSSVLGYPLSNDYLIKAMDYTLTASNVSAYCDVAAEEAMRRRLLSAAQNTQEQLIGGMPAREACAFLQAEIKAVAERETKTGVIVGSDAMADFLEYRDNLEQGDIRAMVSTGYDSIDRVLGGGLVHSGLYILAARPGIGKTTLGLQIADKVASCGLPVLFISLEMEINQLSAKRIAVKSGLSSNRILAGALDEAEMDKVACAANELSNRPLVFNRKPTATVDDIGFLARQVKGLALVVIDYLGLIRPSEGKSIYEHVTFTSNALKRMARQLGVPCLCLAQLNRGVEGRNGGKPQLSDLRDSGAIEQDADGVMLLNRPPVDGAPDSVHPDPIECIIAKNRHGGIGKVDLSFYMGNGRILELWNGRQTR